MAKKPSAKTGYLALAGAVVTIFYSILSATAGFEPTPELVGATVTVAAAAIGLLVPAKSGKYVDWAEDPDAFEVIEGPDKYGDSRWETEGSSIEGTLHAGEIRHGDIVAGGGARG